MRRFVSILKGIIVLMIFILGFSALPFVPSNFQIDKEAQAATVKLNKTKITIHIGETYQLKLLGTKSKIKWSTNNKKYTTVSENGLVTGVKSGTSFITAIAGDKSYTCRVIVMYPTLNKNIFNAGIGNTLQLEINNLPLTYSKNDVHYKSDNESVAFVDNTGLITARSEGYATIKVTFGTYKLQCGVIIKCPATLNVNDITIQYGEKKQIIIENLPKEYTLQDVKWTLDNEGSITVDNEGYITAYSEGYTTVVISFGPYNLNCRVTVPSLTNEEISDFMKKLEYEHGKFNNQEVYIYKNNVVNVDVDYQIEFYNSNDTLVSVSQRNFISLVKGKETILYIDKCDKEYKYSKFRYNSIRGSYSTNIINISDRIEVVATEPYYFTYEYYENLSGAYARDTVKLFDLEVNNNTNDRQTLCANVVYYKGDTIVDIKTFLKHDLDIGKTTIKHPFYDRYFSKIFAPEYDSYRIIF